MRNATDEQDDNIDLVVVTVAAVVVAVGKKAQPLTQE